MERGTSVEAVRNVCGEEMKEMDWDDTPIMVTFATR